MRAGFALCIWALCLDKCLLLGSGFSGHGVLGIDSATIDAEGDVAAASTIEVARHARAKHSDRTLQQRRQPSRDIAGAGHESQDQYQHHPPDGDVDANELSRPRPKRARAGSRASSRWSRTTRGQLLQVDADASTGTSQAQNETPAAFKKRPNPFWALLDFWSRRGSAVQGDGKKCRSTEPGYRIEAPKISPWGEYRVFGPSLGDFDGELAPYEDPDCKRPMSWMGFTAVQFPNSTGIVNDSWVTLDIWVPDNKPPPSSIFVCGSTVASSDLSCLAEVQPDHQIIWVWFGDDKALQCLGLVAFLLGLGFVAACLHSLYLLATLRQSQKPEHLKGLARTSMAMLHVNMLLKATMFVSGVDEMVAMVIGQCLGEVPIYIVDAVFTSGLLLSVLGMLRWTNLLYSSQLYEIALRQGKRVTPGSTAFSKKIFGQLISFAILDLFVILAMVVFVGFVVVGLSVSTGRNYQDAIVGNLKCWQPFPSLLLTAASCMMRHTFQQEGVCQTNLGSLSANVAAEDKESEQSLLQHLAQHPQVELKMSQFCHACRQGDDPLELIDVDGKDPQQLPRGGGLGVGDLRWHAPYVFRKTGSHATICSLPLCMAVFWSTSMRACLTRRNYSMAVPTLEYLVPSQGEFFPPFHESVKDYTLYYPDHVSSIAMMNKGDNLIAKEKDFYFVGRSTGWLDSQENPLFQVTIPAEERVQNALFNMSVEVKGGNFTDEETRTLYRAALAKVSFVMATVRFSSGNWSRCIHLSPFMDIHAAVPETLEQVSIEVSAMLHTSGLPISLESWQEMQRLGDKALASKIIVPIFEEKKRPTFERCDRACLNFWDAARATGCVLSKPVAGGCYHMAMQWTNTSCEHVHSMAPKLAAERSGETNAAISRLLKSTETTIHVCAGNDRRKQCRDGGYLGRVALKGRSFDEFKANFTDERHMSFVNTFYSRSTYQPSATPIFTKIFHLWKGAPSLDFLFVVPQKGLSIESLQKDDSGFTVTIAPWAFGDFPGPLRFLVIARIMDWNFFMSFDESLEEWNGERTGEFDVPGRCREIGWKARLKVPACSRYYSHANFKDQTQIVRIIELDPLFPDKTVIGKVSPRQDTGSRDLPEKEFHITFAHSEWPAVMAFSSSRKQGVCKLDVGSRTAEEIYQMLYIPALLEAAKCVNGIKLTAREGTVNFTPAGFVLWLLRNSPTPHWRVDIIDKFITKYPAVIDEAFDFALEGLVPKLNETYQHAGWKRLWEPLFWIPWNDIFFMSSRLSDVLCFQTGFSQHRIKMAPRFIVDAFSGANTDTKLPTLVRSISDCIELPAPPTSTQAAETALAREWALSTTSPIAVAIDRHDTAVLKVLLEKYGSNYTEVVMANMDEASLSPAVLGYLELVIQTQCSDCAEIVLKYVEQFAEKCKGKELSLECQHFDRNHRWLDLGSTLLETDERLLGAIKMTKMFSKVVHFRALEIDWAGLTNERLAKLWPIWSVLPMIEKLDLGDNLFNLCEAEAACSWTSQDNVKVDEALDATSKDVFPNVREAERVCLQAQGSCQLISCSPAAPRASPVHNNNNAEKKAGAAAAAEAGAKPEAAEEAAAEAEEETCKVFYFSPEASPKIVQAPGSYIRRPSVACHEEHLFEFLAKLKNLKFIDFSGNRLCERGIAQVAQSLPSPSLLETVYLHNVRITGKDLPLLSTMAKKLGEVKTLNISRNQIGFAGFAKLLPGSSLVDLSASNVSWTTSADQATFEMLAEQLSKHSELKILDLSNNKIGDEGIEVLFAAFRNWKKLEYLDLSNIALTDQIFPALMGSLKGCPLKALRLSDNDFGKLSDVKLKAIASLKGLVTLDLHRTGLNGRVWFRTKPDGTSRLSEWLPSLHSLGFEGNRANFSDIVRFLGNSRSHKVRHWLIGHNLEMRPAVLKHMHPVGEFARKVAVAALEFKALGLSGYRMNYYEFFSGFLFRSSWWEKAPALRDLLLDEAFDLKKGYNHDRWVLASSLPNLERLRLRRNGFSRHIIRGLLAWASEQPKLKELWISGNNFSKEDWPRDPRTQTFEKLEVLEGDFTALDVEFLRHYLPRTRVMTSLSIE